VFQERFWIIQRGGWLALALFLAAAVAGLTGRNGPLSRAQAETAQATIDYPRVSRWQMADELRVQFETGAGQGDVLLPPTFLDMFEIERVAPQPRSVMATPRGDRYHFDLAVGAGPKVARFAIRPKAPSLDGRSHVLSISGAPVSIAVTVMP
jgi:hypothetical protein